MASLSNPKIPLCLDLTSAAKKLTFGILLNKGFKKGFDKTVILISG